MIKHIYQLFILVLLFGSCAKSANNDVEIYNNDFENGSLSGITDGIISSFNDSKVLGNYNNGGFNLTINDLPPHDLIDISFDLYIHDSWEGTQQLSNNDNGPDIWQFKVDNKTFINTTFNNYECVPGNICPPQSYPADYPVNSNNPKTGASRTDLPGFCLWANTANGTTLYKIHKNISHSDKTVLIQCLDQLKQKYAADPKCDESWSVDNIKVKVISVK